MKKYFNQTKRFRKDTLSAFYLKINEVLYCSQINPGLLFTARSTMFEVFTDLMNQVGCKSVPAHLFLCHRVFSQRQTCKMCTRIICYETTHSKILSKLYSKWILLNEFVTEAPEDLKRVFELMSCPNVSSFLSLNCFIGCTRLNDSVVPREEENFPDTNLLGANHLMLIFTHFLTVVSRISVNYLYKHLTQKWHKPHVGQLHKELHVGRPLDCVYVYVC